jgi:hypothetical protein
MSKERDIEIAIRARDEFSEVMTRAEKGVETGTSKIKKSFANLRGEIKDLGGGAGEAFADSFIMGFERKGPESYKAVQKWLTGLKGAVVQTWDVFSGKEQPGEEVFGLTKIGEDGLAFDKAQQIERGVDKDAQAAIQTKLAAFEAEAEQGGKEARYEAELERLKEHNIEVVMEMARAGALKADIYKNETELSIFYANKKRDYLITAAEQTTGRLANAMQSLHVASGRKHRAMFEMGKAFAIANTVINTRAAAMGAYNALASITFVGPALGAAAAAAAIAAGAAQIRQIKSAKPGGGTISAGGFPDSAYQGGSFKSQPVPVRLEEPQKEPTQYITISVHNPLSEQNWDAISEDMVNAINKAGDRNVALTIRTAEA